MKNMKNQWYETQHNFKLLIVFILIRSNYLSFYV